MWRSEKILGKYFASPIQMGPSTERSKMRLKPLEPLEALGELESAEFSFSPPDTQSSFELRGFVNQASVLMRSMLRAEGFKWIPVAILQMFMDWESRARTVARLVNPKYEVYTTHASSLWHGFKTGNARLFQKAKRKSATLSEESLRQELKAVNKQAATIEELLDWRSDLRARNEAVEKSEVRSGE
jgi:hypothetical protein